MNFLRLSCTTRWFKKTGSGHTVCNILSGDIERERGFRGYRLGGIKRKRVQLGDIEREGA